MVEEVSRLRREIAGARSESQGMREYVSGEIRGRGVTVVFSRWGKVAAASTATTLIERYGARCLVFTGVAGAVDESLNVGDIVVGDSLVQYDFDASALAGVDRFEVPLLGLSRFSVEPGRVAAAMQAAEMYLREDLAGEVSAEVLKEFRVEHPRVVSGTIGSGDQFIADPAIARGLREEIPGLRCVEMEGGAVAQVAYEHGIPCIVLRTISDRADHGAAVDFARFVEKIASHFTCGSVLRLLEGMEG